MRPEESGYPIDWLRIGERDLGRVSRCLRDQDPDAAGFFLQQAIEKILKAFLLAHRWSLRRIHDLEALLDDASDYDPELESFRHLCQQVAGYYLIERYPMVGVANPSKDDISAALTVAEQLLSKIRDSITG